MAGAILQPFACSVVVNIDFALLVASDNFSFAGDEDSGGFVGLGVVVAVNFNQLSLP